MLPAIDYALSYAPPSAAERTEILALSTGADTRWHQRLDHAVFTVTARHEGSPVGFGLVHTSVTAPTAAEGPLELGAMYVHPAYRRLGIREHVAELRLTYALSMGGTPIAVIDERNEASWRYYHRSPAWAVEKVYTGYFTGLPMGIWVATESRWYRSLAGHRHPAATTDHGAAEPAPA